MTIVTIKGKDSNCELCGEFAELRPYGPNDEWICFDCGMKDKAVTEAKFLEKTNGHNLIIIDARKNTEH